MTTFRRVAAFFGAILVIAYGFGGSSENADKLWLVALLGAGVLLAISWWPPATRGLPVFNRTLLRWATIVLVCFSLVTVQLVRVQVVESSRIGNRVASAPGGEVVTNPRSRLRSLEVQRGRVLDRNGNVLADTQLRPDGTYERTWPEASTASLVGYYSPEIYGSSNIEHAYDDYLLGVHGGNAAEEWLQGVLHEKQRGYDVGLTIDLDLQKQASDLLAGRPGAVVLMDADTGAVLAMAGAPTFDPNQLYANLGQQSDEQIAAIQAYWQQLNNDPNAPLLFRPTQGAYTPGSTFKTLTASAIIDTGRAKLDTMYRDEGIFEVDGRVIEEPNRPDPSVVDYTLEQSYAYSLNVVFAQIGIQLTAQDMWEYGKRFGFGESIPFDIPTTDATQVAATREGLNNRALLADTGFGQGQILASPLEMAMIVAAAEHGGTMMQPYLVDRIQKADGTILDRFGSHEWRRVTTKETAQTVRQLLLACADYGSAQTAQIDGVTVGGKTGTAEVGEGDPHSWFIGFGEAGGRKLVVAVIVEHGGPGSRTALPIGRALLQSALTTP